MIPTFYDLWEYVQIRNRELARQRANRARGEYAGRTAISQWKGLLRHRCGSRVAEVRRATS